MTEPSGSSAKSNSGVYLWTSVGGDTPRSPEPGDLLTKRQELRGLKGCTQVDFY